MGWWIRSIRMWGHTKTPVFAYCMKMYVLTRVLHEPIISCWIKLKIAYANRVCQYNGQNVLLQIRYYRVSNRSLPIYKTTMSIIGYLVIVYFIHPFEKRSHYAVARTVRPSTFSGLFPTCFVISIWNLIHIFSRWHDMWTLSFITIGSFWPSLLPSRSTSFF